MFMNRCFEHEEANMAHMGTNPGMMGMQGCCPSSMCPPVMECPQERICHRQMCYEVPQVSPFM